MIKIDIREKTRDEWLEMRRHAIGGSEAAAILGLNPYSSAYQVFLDKKGLLPDKGDNEAMRQGRDLEEYVAQRFEEASGKKVRRCNFILMNEKYDFMHANVDRLIIGEDAGLECKTTSVYNKSDFESGDVPQTYYVQCQHYMAVTGYKKWYLAVLMLNKSFWWFEIPRNDEDIAVLIAAENDFWVNNVLANKEPAPDGSDRAQEAIQARYPESNGETIELMGYEEALKRYMELDAYIKSLDKEQKEIKQKIQTEMKEAAMAVCGHYAISWKNSDVTRIDTAALKKEMPDVAQMFAKTTSQRRFLLKEI